jgi:hypothetical protein
MQYEGRFAQVSDDELLRRLSSLLGDSRRVEADLVDHIAEVDDRRLYAREACPSMFAYCTDVLHLSEAEAGLRISVARAVREHPSILEMLADGRLHLSGIAMLRRHLTAENSTIVLERAAHRSKSQIEGLLAELAPRPDVPAVIRKLPVAPAPARAAAPSLFVSDAQHRPDGVASTVTSAPVIQPLAPERFKVQFTAGAELRRKLERLQKLMSADLAQIIDRAVTEKLERLERKRFGLTKSPRQSSLPEDKPTTDRYVPAALKRAVCIRDEGRCRYTDAAGQRCKERDWLEYHHRFPYALGGQHTLRDVCLMCHAHNQYEADRDFGRALMAQHRSRSGGRKRGSG